MLCQCIVYIGGCAHFSVNQHIPCVYCWNIVRFKKKLLLQLLKNVLCWGGLSFLQVSGNFVIRWVGLSCL